MVGGRFHAPDGEETHLVPCEGDFHTAGSLSFLSFQTSFSPSHYPPVSEKPLSRAYVTSQDADHGSWPPRGCPHICDPLAHVTI